MRKRKIIERSALIIMAMIALVIAMGTVIAWIRFLFSSLS